MSESNGQPHNATVPEPGPLPLHRPLVGQDEALLADIASEYTLAPGSLLRAAPCIVCRTSLGGGPVLFHVLITLDECPDGGGHIMAAAVARHAQCIPRNDRTLTHAIERVLSHAGTG